jgi:hypothetical protein
VIADVLFFLLLALTIVIAVTGVFLWFNRKKLKWVSNGYTDAKGGASDLTNEGHWGRVGYHLGQATKAKPNLVDPEEIIPADFTEDGVTHWDYRLLRLSDDQGEWYTGIFEVYYDNNDEPEFYLETPVSLFSYDGTEGIQTDLEYIMTAFNKPLLVKGDFVEQENHGVLVPE